MKTIVITGASRGIGLATAKKFLDEGWRVIGTHLHTPLSIVHPHFTSLRFDQSSPENIIGFISEIKNIVPHIDVLVNNAAVLLDADNEGVDMDSTRRAFETDLFGVIDVTERLLPFMSAGGHIINISSQYGSFSFPVDDATSMSYRMAKAALNMYTRTLSFRVVQKKIIVSSLDPGWVETDMGLSVADSLSRPDRKPKEPAEDIYRLVLDVTESGHFWRFGKKREW
jgi:NAD(P)-dependent dehydrogenase (short-subunit alcohol dehydrogenase family)